MPSIQYYLHQLRVLPASEIIRRAAAMGRRSLRDRASKLRASVLGTEMSDRAFIERAFDPGQRPEETRSRLRELARPVLFTGPEHLAAALLTLSAGERSEIIFRADAACRHTFDLLGSGPVDLGTDIPWHSDFKSGYRWDRRTWYRDISIPYGKADIKVPWELSRFTHAVTLGQAYQVTGDERYAREFMAQVTQWINENPPQFGPNWACTMDVAIRACNWVAGYGLLGHSRSLTDAFLLAFLKSLFQHGIHIRGNLEYTDALTSNHYLSNITGLVYVGTLFPGSREAAGWLEFGIGELRREMDKQVYPDGCDFEASTSYHRLVLELFFYPTLLAVANSRDFSGDDHVAAASAIFGTSYIDRLRRMFDAVLHLLQPNGRMPQIGDNDSGMLHRYSERHLLDMRYLLALGAVFFRDQCFKVSGYDGLTELRWTFGDRGMHLWSELQETRLAAIPSTSCPDAGWYVMRNGGDSLVISCGPNGQNGNGGHAHNDKLSFTLCWDGEDVIVDPGTFVYTPDPSSRNRFRSTAAHNTVAVNGLEQNRFDASPRGLFHMNDDARPRVLLWEASPGRDRFLGEHFGFDRDGFHHQREILFDKRLRAVMIRDTVTGSKPSSQAFFHAAPGIGVAAGERNVFRIGPVVMSFQGEARVRIEDYAFSGEYGRKERGARLCVSFGNDLTTSIVPATSGGLRGL